MLFADETFLKSPTVYDVVGVLGFFAAIWSIWHAKADIEKRIKEASDKSTEAARDEIRRVARAITQMGISDAVRSLLLAREATIGNRWSRAADLSELCLEQLDRMAVMIAIELSGQRMRLTKQNIRELIVTYRALATRKNPKHKPEDMKRMSEAISFLHEIEGRGRTIQSGAIDE